MTCPSGKIRYRDQLGARIALSGIRKKRTRRDKNERAAYQCPACNGWHLTSKVPKCE